MFWRPNLSEPEQRLLWLGWVGPMEKPKGYVMPADARVAIDRYNEALMAICSERHLECYDLASAIPRDTSAFFDDCHFNRAGARTVALLVSRRISAMLSKPSPQMHASKTN